MSFTLKRGSIPSCFLVIGASFRSRYPSLHPISNTLFIDLGPLFKATFTRQYLKILSIAFIRLPICSDATRCYRSEISRRTLFSWRGPIAFASAVSKRWMKPRPPKRASGRECEGNDSGQGPSFPRIMSCVRRMTSDVQGAESPAPLRRDARKVSPRPAPRPGWGPSASGRPTKSRPLRSRRSRARSAASPRPRPPAPPGPWPGPRPSSGRPG